jgi:diaminopimelate epimerase
MIQFTKMHGIGNDFVMVDAIRTPVPATEAPKLSRAMNDRKFGIGGDGLILVEKGQSAPFRMRMFNPDGSESEMCGNGVRCVAKFVRDKGHTGETNIPIETGAGLLELRVGGDGQVRVDMGPARLTRGEIGVTGEPCDTFHESEVEAEGLTFTGTAVSMGNPHLVIFTEDVAGVPLEVWGPALENHPMFPRRINVHFVQVLNRGEIVQRTWERGAGITLACGTGACACAVAAYLGGQTGRNVKVRLPGGDLQIEYAEDGRVFMTGPAETVFEGCWFG